MRKRLIFAALAAALLMSTAGCGDRPPPNQVFSTGDVHGRMIGTLHGSPSVILAEELGTAREFFTAEELMQNLRTGLLDCVIMESMAAQEIVSATSGVRILSEPLLEYEMRFAVAKENAQLLRAVNSALVALRENGTLRGLVNKYVAGRSYTYVPPENVEQRPGYLSLALSPDNPPYSFRGADGVFSGLDVEVAQAVCDYLGVELKILEFDARELVTAVWLGRADLSLGWVPVEGEQLVEISDAYASSSHVVVVRRQRGWFRSDDE